MGGYFVFSFWSILEIIVVIIIISIALILHEIGHAIAVVLQDKKAKAEVYLGTISKENKWKLSLGRITCYLTIAFSGICFVANAEELPSTTNKQRLFILAGGPIASLFGFIALYIFSRYTSGMLENIMYTIAMTSFCIFLFSVIPFKYPAFLKNIGGAETDGFQMLKILKQKKVVS